MSGIKIGGKVVEKMGPVSGFRTIKLVDIRRQTILWSVAPNGRTETGKLKFSVVVSPRLEFLQGANEGKLRLNFPDFIDWPGWLQDTLWGGFRLTFLDSKKTTPGAYAKATTQAQRNQLGVTKAATHDADSKPDSGAWSAIFPDSTIVRSYVFAPNGIGIRPRAIDNADLVNSINQLYSHLSLASIINPPTSAYLMGLDPFKNLVDLVGKARGISVQGIQNRNSPMAGVSLGGISALGAQEKGMSGAAQPLLVTLPPEVVIAAGLPVDSTSSMRIGTRAAALPQTTSALKPLFQANTANGFSDLLSPRQPAKNLKIPGVHIYDFHEILSVVREYPVMLRHLGLVLDLEVDPPAEDAKGEYYVRLEHKNLGSEATTKMNVLPWTLCSIGKGEFHAVSRFPARQEKGLLHLDDKKTYESSQLDTDGGGLKVLKFVSQWVQTQDRGAGNTAQSNAVPAMRSVGIGVRMPGRPTVQADYLNKVRDNLEKKLYTRDAPFYPTGRITGVNPNLVLQAEDLTRGFRVDAGVYHESKSSWRWYSLCHRTVTYKYGGTTLKGVFDEGTVTTGLAKLPAPTNGHTHEMYDTLFRWDGWSLCAPREGATDDDTMLQPFNTSQGLFLNTELSVRKRTLPRLRFGRKYRFRARTVDIAGNSLGAPPLPADDGSFPSDFPEADSGPATAASPYRRYEPIGSPMTLLTRDLADSPGESLETLVIRSTRGEATSDTTTRHLAPPKISTPTAVALGMFDGPVHLDSQKYDALKAARNATVDRQKIYGTKAWQTDYLIDPLAAGVAFGHLPGTKELVKNYPYDTATEWPKRNTLLFTLKDGTAPPTEAGGEITVSLPPAEVMHVPYASVPAGEKAIDLLAIWGWIEDQYALQKNDPNVDHALIDKAYADAKVWALHGVHWMLTPRRDLMLVHAVKQPLWDPKITPVFNPTASKPKVMRRDLHSTWSYVDLVIRAHGKSTVKLDLRASWDEIVNDPTKPKGIRKVAADRHVLSVPVHLGPPVYGYPTTSGGLGFYYDTVDSPDDVGAMLLGAYLDKVVVEPARKNVAVASENQDALAVAKRYKLLELWNKHAADLAKIGVPRHEFGDTKHRLVTYVAIGTTRFREYFKPVRTKPPVPGDKTEEQFTVTGETVQVHIPNSARPDRLKPLYIIPTFGWQDRQKTRGGESRKRKGNGLRVYLEGPWYLSGDKEQLGVVVVPEPKGLNSYLGKYVSAQAATHLTQWAQDPIWKSSTLPHNFPGKDDFLNGEFATGLTLEEFGGEGGGNVGVVGYDVEFDQDRGLWYADIEMDPGDSYMPFVRLALARYQPYSVPNAHLSRVAIADFVQLAPDRKASITKYKKGGGGTSVHVTVSGISYGNKNPKSPKRGVVNLSNAAKVATGGAAAVEKIGEQALIGAGESLVKKAFSRKVDTGSVVEASLESARAGVNDEILKWEEVKGSTVKLDASVTTVSVRGAGLYTWAGDVSVPAGGPYRLVIREYEVYQSVHSATPTRRLVYAETFDL